MMGWRTTSLLSFSIAGWSPIPSLQALHKFTIVHIASSRKDSGCTGVEVEVDVPATEKDRSGRELETDRAGGVAPKAAALSDHVLFGACCREEVPCL
jgi:hypothetical protein